MACILDGSKLTLSGYVGDLYEGIDHFSYPDVVLALAQVDDASGLTVHLLSDGGYASEGAAIYALLVSRSGRTDVVVEGIAASAASLIAMAGETVSMAEGSVMMIHDPMGFTQGNSADHAKQIESLEALATAYARIYAAKSGKSVEDCREVMKAERWYTAEEAIAEGFADSAVERLSAPITAFMNIQHYAHAPKTLRAQARNWLKANPQAAQSAAPGQKEITMTDKTKADGKPAEQIDVAKAQADAVKADRERRAAIMALPEREGRDALAEYICQSTDLTPEEAKLMLAAAPAPDAPKPEAAALATAGLGGKPEAKTPLSKTALSDAVTKFNSKRR
ncbi:head maturation protease, ClpP-related [Paracoccus sp. 22332]|uniref:head maturation protease, ClpP-related n=1 Tax=Paracoccus sp. 22332 TaxID=3453913 RepID=UPI003F852304